MAIELHSNDNTTRSTNAQADLSKRKINHSEFQIQRQYLNWELNSRRAESDIFGHFRYKPDKKYSQ